MSTQLAAWHVLILDARGPRLVFENSSSALTDLALLLVRPEFEQAPDHTCSCGPQSLQSGDRTRTHRISASRMHDAVSRLTRYYQALGSIKQDTLDTVTE